METLLALKSLATVTRYSNRMWKDAGSDSIWYDTPQSNIHGGIGDAGLADDVLIVGFAGAFMNIVMFFT